MKNLLDYNLDELKSIAVFEWGVPAFRGAQVYKWLAGGASSFDEMTNLSKDLREKLASDYSCGSLEVLKVQEASDGTRKFLFGLSDGEAIETVFMKYSYGNSICVSSQAGCRMGCKFCASGLNGLVRNLTAGEILGQIVAAERTTGEKISHIVVMGCGEPFDNYENVSKFINIVTDENGRSMSSRNITVSTCGLVPMIERFASDFPQVNLAISLHAVSQEAREKLMPVAKAYSYSDLLSACKKYCDKTHRRITFEYALTAGVNDSEDDARALAKNLSGMLCHVNLIPLNSVTETGLKGSSRTSATAFQQVLESKGIPCTIRRELGSEIDAACGQLRLR